MYTSSIYRNFKLKVCLLDIRTFCKMCNFNLSKVPSSVARLLPSLQFSLCETLAYCEIFLQVMYFLFVTETVICPEVSKALKYA